jgi:autotransporter-associated beta strand protein
LGGKIDTNGYNSTLSGNIGGQGGLEKVGLGNLTLTGNNSYTGGTTISGGSLTGNTTSLIGNFLNNASLVFDQATTGTFSGNMKGSGSLIKMNTVLLLRGPSYTGGTTINGGTLVGNSTSLTGYSP